MQYRYGQAVVVTKPKLSRRRKVIGLTVLVIVVGLIAHWLSSPAVGHQETVNQKLTKNQPKAAPLPPATTLNNPYFSLSLPPGYNPQGNSSQNPTALFGQTILKPGADGTVVIVLQVISFDGSLANNSSYRLRQQEPQTYQLTTKTIDGQTVSIASRLDGQNGEVVAFWPHGGQLATLAVTNGDTASDQTVLINLLQAWQWK